MALATPATLVYVVLVQLIMPVVFALSMSLLAVAAVASTASPASISPSPVLWMAASTALHALSCVSDSTTAPMPPLATTMFALPALALLVVFLTLTWGTDSMPVLTLFAEALCFGFLGGLPMFLWF